MSIWQSHLLQGREKRKEVDWTVGKYKTQRNRDVLYYDDESKRKTQKTMNEIFRVYIWLDINPKLMWHLWFSGLGPLPSEVTNYCQILSLFLGVCFVIVYGTLFGKFWKLQKFLSFDGWMITSHEIRLVCRFLGLHGITLTTYCTTDSWTTIRNSVGDSL